MRRSPTVLRLGVVFLFVLGLLSPVASIGVGAQDLTCDDFNSQRAAQAILESDPLLEESLDPDGNGIACDHDDDGAAPSDDEDAVTDDDEDGPVSNDGATYLEDVQGEVDAVLATFDRYIEIESTFNDATDAERQDLIVELEELATGWIEYPDVAAEFEAPAGFEDVGDAYLDFADLVGETGDLWFVWWEIPGGDPDEDAAFDDFVDASDDAFAAADDVLALIDEAGGSEPTDDPVDDPADDPSDGPSGDGDAYVSDIQSELDLLTEQSERFMGLFESGTAEDVAEINDIAADWVEYPDVAFAFVAPEGFENIEDAYLDLADTFGEAGELWEAFWAIPAEDDDEEEIAFAAFEDAFNDAQDQIAEVQDLLDEAGGGSPTDDPPDDPTDDPVPAGDDYVADIQDELDLLTAQVDRFVELYDLGAAEGSDEINDLAAEWVEYPDIAAELTAPDGTVGFEGIEAAYFDLADTLGEAGELWEAFWAIPAEDDDEEAIALAAFEEVFLDAQDQIVDLQNLLDEAGTSGPSPDNPSDDPTDDPIDDPDNDPSDDPDADSGDYLATVRENADTWNDSFDRFDEIFGLGEDATEEDFSEAGEIVFSWALAPDVALELDVPEGMEDVQDAYEAYADGVGLAGEFISEWLAADLDTPEADEALDSFFDAMAEAEDLYAELDALLEDEGE